MVNVITFQGTKPLGLTLEGGLSGRAESGQEVLKVTPGGQAQRLGVREKWTLIRVDVPGQHCPHYNLFTALRAVEDTSQLQIHLSFNLPLFNPTAKLKSMEQELYIPSKFSKPVLANCIAVAADGSIAAYCMIRTVGREWNACVVEDVMTRVHNARKLVGRDEMTTLMKQTRNEVSTRCKDWTRKWHQSLETVRITGHCPPVMRMLKALVALAVPQRFHPSSAATPTEFMRSFFRWLPRCRSSSAGAALREVLVTGLSAVLPATGSPQMDFAQTVLNQYSHDKRAMLAPPLDEFSIAAYDFLHYICAESHRITDSQWVTMAQHHRAKKTISTLDPFVLRVSKPWYMLGSAYERAAADAEFRASLAPPACCN